MTIRLEVLTTVALVAVSAAAARPTLQVADDNPVVVEGWGFIAGERVTLRTTIEGQDYEVAVKVDGEGLLKAQIAEKDAECLPFRVYASGDRGSQAVTPRRTPPPCGVPIPP